MNFCKVESVSKHVVCRQNFANRNFFAKFEVILQGLLKMKWKIANPNYHIIYWLLVVSILTFVFGRSWGSGKNAFFYISMLLPVVMGTSYFFNFFLVPKYLLRKKYFWFGINFFYMLIISLYLQMLVLIFSFMYLANFSLSAMGPNSTDIILLTVVMYLIVFVGSFLVMLQQLAERQKEIETFVQEKEKSEQAFLELISNRQQVRIPYDKITYIESLSDYIKVNSSGMESVTSKEKISSLGDRLPGHFIRIHRSFIINTKKVTRFNASEVELDDIKLNIGRTYKKEVAMVLRSI